MMHPESHDFTRYPSTDPRGELSNRPSFWCRTGDEESQRVLWTYKIYLEVNPDRCDANYTVSTDDPDVWPEEDEEEKVELPVIEYWRRSRTQRQWRCCELAKYIPKRVPFRTQHFYRPSQPHG